MIAWFQFQQIHCVSPVLSEAYTHQIVGSHMPVVPPGYFLVSGLNVLLGFGHKVIKEDSMN